MEKYKDLPNGTAWSFMNGTYMITYPNGDSRLFDNKASIDRHIYKENRRMGIPIKKPDEVPQKTIRRIRRLGSCGPESN